MVVSGSHTFSFLEEFLLLWTFWLQWIYKSCSEMKEQTNKSNEFGQKRRSDTEDVLPQPGLSLQILEEHFPDCSHSL